MLADRDRLADDRCDIDRLALLAAWPRVLDEVARKPQDSLSARTDPAELLDVGGVRALRLELAHEVLRVDGDRRQRVVELVHHARGELAQGREALGAND